MVLRAQRLETLAVRHRRLRVTRVYVDVLRDVARHRLLNVRRLVTKICRAPLLFAKRCPEDEKEDARHLFKVRTPPLSTVVEMSDGH